MQHKWRRTCNYAVALNYKALHQTSGGAASKLAVICAIDSGTRNDVGKRGFFATTFAADGLSIAAMDYSPYIFGAYACAALALGGLILHTWIAARRAK
jgi:heme exporter protein CcmD